MKAIAVSAQVREITGKKVKKIRKEGLLPVGVYGKGVKSASLSVPAREFEKVYKKVGQTGLVELKYDGKSQHVLVKNVQIHPVTRQILHAELHAVKLTEKIKARIPVVLIGESPAVRDNVGVLLQTLNEVEVEALPTELPETIQVDVSALAVIDDAVVVSDLTEIKEVTILTQPEEIVVKVAPAVSEETAKEVAAEEAAKTAQGEVEGEEGVKAAGGEEAQPVMEADKKE